MALDRIAAFAQAGHGGADSMGLPPRRLDHVIEAGPGSSPQEIDQALGFGVLAGWPEGGCLRIAQSSTRSSGA